MKNFKLVVFFLSIFHLAQTGFNYSLSLIPVTFTNVPGLHSYAYAQSGGKWLIIGGRKDGIHARQPHSSFPASQNNTNIFVVDVINKQIWSSSVNVLPVGIREQLQSTNMCFYQDSDTLYIIGGYGFSASSNNHITHPYLTTIQVSALINAIQSGQSITPYFKQIQNPVFAVSGGHLKKIKNVFYLVGGHRFDGTYNPFNNPTFTQQYTNQIRKFTINNFGSQLGVTNYTAITDPVHLRRRDYNLAPQVFPNGDEGLTIFSGVFQLNVDLPFLYPVDITENNYNPVTNFNQYLSHYHCPVADLYDAQNNLMHTLFFGGMSQYYYTNNVLVQDNQVPFVKTISRVTRDASGNLTEYVLPVEMPGLKASGAEFIPNLNLPHYTNKVIKLNDITQNTFLIGHIYGGILSPLLNPFSNNQTSATSADPSIYEVWLTANPISIKETSIDGKNPFDVDVFPNPFKTEFTVKFDLKNDTKVTYVVTNEHGQILEKSENKVFTAGENQIKLSFPAVTDKNELLLTIIFDNKFYVTKKLIKH
jgi:hypothetical protein